MQMGLMVRFLDENLEFISLTLTNDTDEWIAAEFLEIKQTIAAEKAITVPGWKVMFTVPQWRTRLMHGVAVQVFTQMSGISMFCGLQSSLLSS